MGADLMKLKEAMGGVRQPEFGADKQAQLRRRNAAEGSRDVCRVEGSRKRISTRQDEAARLASARWRHSRDWETGEECRSVLGLVLRSSFSSSHQPSPIMKSVIACLLLLGRPHCQPNPSPVSAFTPMSCPIALSVASSWLILRYIAVQQAAGFWGRERWWLRYC